MTNPRLPSILTTLPLPDLPLKLRISGNLLYMADDLAGLLIYDVSTPSAPKLLSQTTSIVLAADVVISGSTAYVAADTDGLAIFDISNPSHPILLSKTSLARIDPFYYDNPYNEALSLAVNNGIVYVGTINDNGIVFGVDCSNLSSPRIVSLYGHGDFILTWVGSLLFDGNELYLGGSLGFTYPVEQVDMSLPFDNINQYFPPLALQSIPSPSQTYSSARMKLPASSNPAGRFSKATARARTNIINRNAARFSPEAATRFFLQRAQVPSVH